MIMLPHRIDLNEFEEDEWTIDDWVKENNILMNRLVSDAAEIFVAEADVETVSLLEVWCDLELFAVIDLSRESLEEALEYGRKLAAESEKK